MESTGSFQKCLSSVPQDSDFMSLGYGLGTMVLESSVVILTQLGPRTSALGQSFSALALTHLGWMIPCCGITPGLCLVDANSISSPVVTTKGQMFLGVAKCILGGKVGLDWEPLL